MSVVVAILNKRRAIFGDTRNHKFPYNAAKVGRHEQRFKALDPFGRKLLVDKSEKICELSQRQA